MGLTLSARYRMALALLRRSQRFESVAMSSTPLSLSYNWTVSVKAVVRVLSLPLLLLLHLMAIALFPTQISKESPGWQEDRR